MSGTSKSKLSTEPYPLDLAEGEASSDLDEGLVDTVVAGPTGRTDGRLAPRSGGPSFGTRV